MCAASADPSSASPAGHSAIKSANWIAADHADGRITAWLMHEGEARQQVSAGSSGELMADVTAVISQLHDCAADTPILLSDDSLRGGDTGTITVPAKIAERPMGDATLGGHPLRVLGGLSQATPPAVMRGACNRIAGFLSLNPDWDGVICVAGATTHWALISANEVVSFQSFMTSQLWQGLAASLNLGDTPAYDRTQRAELTASMDTVQSKPEALAARLAELQATQGAHGNTDAARLWGLLLGAELSAARPYWLGQNIALIAPPPLDTLYQAALDHQGVPVTQTDADRMALAGLVSAWRAMTT
ncbi:2-dehydro-3-deoxygalactonokinase [Phaeobacter sp. BS52]|uniref:2-dehydro-3-deoxygalactonokinase n=1 Tax=Phaeobacter sp. BS52 TaxID=2907241 RepID=UPI00386ED1C1